MARKKLLHLKSGVTVEVNGNTVPKLPTSSQIELGEIAINYATDYETLAIKNSSGDIVTFSNDKIIMDYVDEKIIQGIDPVQTTGTSTGDVMSQSAVTRELSNKLAVNDFNTYSGAVDTSIAGKASQGDLNAISGTVTAHTADTTIHVTSTEKTNLDSLETNIEAISGITSTKVGNWDTAATNSHTHTNKSVLDDISSSDITNWNGKTSNTGTVTKISTASGITGGDITTSGTIGLATVGTAGTYKQVVVDAYGRVTSGSTSGGAAEANYFIIGSTEGSESMPSFDSYTDTVHVTQQTLTSAQKLQARTNIEAVSSSDIASMHLENKVQIVAANGASLTAEVGKYYRYDAAVGTLEITLPIPSDTAYTSGIIFSLTTDTTTNVTFTSSATIKYQEGYEIESDSTYEINAMYNGSFWSVAAIKFE